MREVFVVAGGQSRFGAFPGLSVQDLFIQAYKDLLATSGFLDQESLAPAIDAVYVGTLGCGGAQLGQIGPFLIKAVGIGNVPVTRVENACASGGFALLQGIIGVASGNYTAVLVAGIEKMCDLSADKIRYWLGVSGDTEYERLAGLTFPGIYAIMANRYLYENQIGREYLSKVAVKNHSNGSFNTRAHFPKQITMEEAVASPMVADPLNLFDCSPISDGASVALLCSGEKAAELGFDKIKVIGYGAGSDSLSIFGRKRLTALEATIAAARSAYTMAGIQPKEIDFAEVHDCFTIAELLAYEDLGFCDRGQGYQLLEQGVTALDGSLPVNPSGGLKSKGHPLGATGVAQLVEIYRQLNRSVEEKRQIPKEIRTGLTHNVGGSGGTAVVTILRKEKE